METPPRASLPPDRLRALEEALEVRFESPDLLLRAMVHSSAKDAALPCNERMEFLGDSVLGMVVSEHLYHLFPDFPEGELSSIKSVVVSATSLAACAKTLNLGEFVILGKGILQKKTIPDSVLANALEATIAAIYMDLGLEPARMFVLRILRPRIEEVLKDQHAKNWKSILQQHTQKNLACVPAYRVVGESGPDHEKSFLVSVDVAGKVYGPGGGKTKKDAEQAAARIAFEGLQTSTAEGRPAVLPQKQGPA